MDSDLSTSENLEPPSELESVEVLIERPGPWLGIGIGFLSDGTRLHVKNGDLFIGKVVRVSIRKRLQEPTGSVALAELANSIQSEAMLESLLKGSEGLVRTEDLELLEDGNLLDAFFWKDALVFPHPEIADLVRFLFARPELWRLASIRVLSERTIHFNRAPRFGPDFREAVEQILGKSRGIVKSAYLVETPKRLEWKSYCADMLVMLKTNKKESSLELEAWQSVGESNEVTYTHAIFSEKTRDFSHLDGAVIEFTQSEKEKLFHEAKKLKGASYRKLFRLHGIIKYETAYEIIKVYLPLDQLVEEYFLSQVQVKG